MLMFRPSGQNGSSPFGRTINSQVRRPGECLRAVLILALFDASSLSVRTRPGDRRAHERREPGARAALLDYLRASASHRRVLKQDSPLWTRHARAGTPGPALTSHAFAKI